MPNVPNWTPSGTIPPYDPADPVSFNRSPYPVSLVDVITRFATTAERCKILDGFLRFREDLSSAGLTNGFQWLDGSFMENIETIASRAPNDIDVVTFYRLPAGVTQQALAAANPHLFLPPATKAKYSVDAYFVELATLPELLVTLTAYWYSVWSHKKRSDAWKGYLQIDLGPAENAAAKSQLAGLMKPVGGP